MAKVNAEVTGTVPKVGRVLTTIIQGVTRGVTMALSLSRVKTRIRSETVVPLGGPGLRSAAAMNLRPLSPCPRRARMVLGR